MAVKPDTEKPASALGSEQTPNKSRGELRREALLASGRRVFLQHGFAGASIDEIVRLTGGSKASLYSYFGSKDGLFEAMVEEGCDDFLRNVAIPRKLEGSLQETLIAFGMRFFEVFSDPERVMLMRAIMAEANRAPHLANAFYARGPMRACKQLASFFTDCHKRGLLHAPDAEFAAIQFITLIKGHCQFRSLLGLSPIALEMPIEEFVATNVDLFLKGRNTAANA